MTKEIRCPKCRKAIGELTIESGNKIEKLDHRKASNLTWHGYRKCGRLCKKCANELWRF